MKRIKYYSPSDLSIGFHFERFRELIKEYKNLDYSNIISIVEIYNALKFIEMKIFVNEISIEEMKVASKVFKKKLNQFFKEVDKQDISDFFRLFFLWENIDFYEYRSEKIIFEDNVDKNNYQIYRKDFIECFEKYKLHEIINEKELQDIIEKYEISIEFFLRTNYFIDNYSSLIRKKYLESSKNIELLLTSYIDEGRIISIPSSVSNKELYQLCERYIESEHADLNYLRIVSNGIQGFKEFVINPKVKAKAKKRAEQIETKILADKEHVFEQSICIYTEESEYNNSNVIFKSLIDVEFIKIEKLKENLLQYMMYFNGFFTDNWVLNLCSFPNIESTTLMRLFSGAKTKKNYETSIYFHNKNTLQLLSFKIYQKKLQEIHNYRIEELVVYFFSNYCKERFMIDWLPLDFSNQFEKLHIQTKNLFTLEEQIRKQWKLYVEENKVDKELFELEFTPSFSSLKSKLRRKNIYVNSKNENINQVLFLLFSDQSGIIYINEYIKGNDFIELLNKNKIKRSDFHSYQIAAIDFLINNEIVSLDSQQRIYLTQQQSWKILILQNIYQYGVDNYYYLNHKVSSKKILKEKQKIIDQMIDDGLLNYEDTLFSRPEIDYLNYILNNSEFDNALGLRNKYLHGAVIEENEEEYYLALIIIVVYVIKINEELRIINDENL
ncbi:hypothetical protein ACWN6Y_03200 [Vagococcus teuberi]|uniref:Uncharacterized protein n=1 Tax=Vagococcus teuberi TaxID=519472 RepID=A0A1J0A4P4_9ENTE|nr:hypothetical protein [Vagococcus teuberi]APB30889.1 hypothetical protein BHY08_03010 [Vagococcus teuberi]